MDSKNEDKIIRKQFINNLFAQKLHGIFLGPQLTRDLTIECKVENN